MLPFTLEIIFQILFYRCLRSPVLIFQKRLVAQIKWNNISVFVFLCCGGFSGVYLSVLYCEDYQGKTSQIFPYPTLL